MLQIKSQIKQSFLFQKPESNVLSQKCETSSADKSIHISAH